MEFLSSHHTNSILDSPPPNILQKWCCCPSLQLLGSWWKARAWHKFCLGLGKLMESVTRISLHHACPECRAPCGHKQVDYDETHATQVCHIANAFNASGIECAVNLPHTKGMRLEMMFPSRHDIIYIEPITLQANNCYTHDISIAGGAPEKCMKQTKQTKVGNRNHTIITTVIPKHFQNFKGIKNTRSSSRPEYVDNRFVLKRKNPSACLDDPSFAKLPGVR